MYNPKQMLSGIMAGIFAPALMIYLIYAVKFSKSSFDSFFETAINQHIASPIIALSIIVNLGLFFLFIKFNKLWASRGVLLSTLLYGALMLYIKMAL